MPMKWVIKVICPLMLCVFSCGIDSGNDGRYFAIESLNEKNDSSNFSQSSHDSLLNKHAKIKPLCDSTYVIGDYLFVGSKLMKFDFFSRKKPLPVENRMSKGDTLFIDERNILLGYIEDLCSEDRWVYKKYRNEYKFNLFSVDSVYKGKLASPDFKTDSAALYFRTRIRQGCADKGVNFGGHFTIVEWGCGCMCRSMAIVDRMDGRVFYSVIPFDTMDGHYGDAYKINSRMLMVNTGFLDEAENCNHKGYYRASWGRRPSTYEWQDSVFVKLD